MLTLNEQLELAKLETETPLTLAQEKVLKNISIHRCEDKAISFNFHNILTEDGSGVEIVVDIMPDGKFHTFCNKITEDDMQQLFHFDEAGVCDATL